MNPILEVKNLTKTFTRAGQPPFTAVRDVHFFLFPGEALGLIGESGSGKSTVANMVTRLIDVTEGNILLDGEDITHISGKPLRKAYQKIQMVFQTPTESFDPRRTLGDGIAEPLYQQGIPKPEALSEAMRLLLLCGLAEDFANRFPHQVSGGQCQRAAIARAIAVKPQVLICDEATSSLDVTVQKEIMALLSELRKSFHLAVLLICHDIALVQQFCDRALVMYHGEIVEEGEPNEIIRHPQNDYTKRLIESVYSV